MLVGADPDPLNFSMEGGALCGSAVMHKTPFLDHLCQLLFHVLKCGEVFLLNFSVLHLDNSKVFFVLFRQFPESLCELARLLTVDGL